MNTKNEMISELWEGKIQPRNNDNEKKHHKKWMLRCIGNERKCLLSSLNDEQKKLLDKYDELMTNLYMEAREEAFSDGFKTGMRLAAEALFEN